MGKSRLVIESYEQHGLVRYSLQSGSPIHPNARRLGMGDEQGLCWTPISSLRRFFTSFSRHKSTCAQLNELMSTPHWGFKPEHIDRVQCTHFRSDGWAGRIYEDEHGVVQQDTSRL